MQKKYNRILIASVGAWFVALIDGCADALLAGAFLDEAAVSAISLVEPLSSVISFVAYLISMGSAIMFSRECGAFRREKAYQYVGQGLIASLAASVILVVAMLMLCDPMMSFYGASEEVTALAKDYYSCEIFYAAVCPAYYLVYQLVMVDGDELFSFLACFASAVFNVAASLLLVGSYGVKGLALGTVIGTVAGFIVYCIHFLRKTNSVHLKLHFNMNELWGVMKISSSISMTLLYIALIDIVMNKFIISRFSEAYIPAYTVVNFILNLGAMFCSLYDAGSGFLSMAYGENNPAEIRKTMHIAYRAMFIFAGSLLVVLELFAPLAPDLYGITDPAVRAAAVFAARVIALSCPTMAVYYLFCTYYPTVGHVELGHILSAIYMLISPLALAIPLGIAFGFNGMSVGFAFTSIVAVGVTALIIRVKYGKEAVPLVLPETDEESISYELQLTEESIVGLCEVVEQELLSRGISASVINEVQLVLEESYMTILGVNKGKNIITECNLLISDKTLRLITRDNGKIFDITNSDATVKDMRSYLLALLMERNPGRANITTVSFNRNSYVWKLQE